VLYNATPTTSSPARPFGGPSRRIGCLPFTLAYPVPVAEDWSAGGVRDRMGPVPLGPSRVRVTSGPQGTNGHQRSPTAKRNRRSTNVQLKQLAQRRLAALICGPRGYGSELSSVLLLLPWHLARNQDEDTRRLQRRRQPRRPGQLPAPGRSACLIILWRGSGCVRRLPVLRYGRGGSRTARSSE
jgi:hypothetical protein